MPKAQLLIRVKEAVSGGIREVVIWLLPEPLPGIYNGGYHDPTRFRGCH